MALAIIILLLGLVINDKLLPLILFISVIIERIYMQYIYRFIHEFNLRDITMPSIDYNLIKERHILLLLLIFGEGLVVNTDLISHTTIQFNSIMLTILFFLIVIMYFFRIYEEFTILPYNSKSLYKNHYQHMFLAYGLLILYSTLNNIINFGLDPFNRTIIILTMFSIVASHLFFNSRKIDRIVSVNEYTFRKIDNYTLLIMFLITLPEIFVHNIYIFALILGIFFSLHLVALPFRFQYVNYTLEKEVYKN